MGSSLMRITVSTPKEPLRILVVKVQPNIKIWNILIQCEGVEDMAAVKETVESLNRLGYLALVVRSDIELAT